MAGFPPTVDIALNAIHGPRIQIDAKSRMTTRDSQLEQLRSLLKGLVPENAFYSRRLRESGITEPIDSLEDFFRRMPFTLKSELIDDRAKHPPAH